MYFVEQLLCAIMAAKRRAIERSTSGARKKRISRVRTSEARLSETERQRVERKETDRVHAYYGSKSWRARCNQFRCIPLWCCSSAQSSPKCRD